jgi:hypothetical protein
MSSLRDCNFEINHISGSQNTYADTLSRKYLEISSGEFTQKTVLLFNENNSEETCSQIQRIHGGEEYVHPGMRTTEELLHQEGAIIDRKLRNQIKVIVKGCETCQFCK